MDCNDEAVYCHKALDAIGRRIFVISPEYELLAANRLARQGSDTVLQGITCHEYLYDREEPCESCPTSEVLLSGKKVVREMFRSQESKHTPLCLQATPIMDGETIEAVVVLDLNIGNMSELEQELTRTNAFLTNLLMGCVDGVIAADMNGKVIIFNDAAAEMSGYSVEDALTNLNIRDFYSSGVAYEVMAKLRGNSHGGKGKLKSYRVETLRKDGTHIPISLSAGIVYDGDKEVATVGFFYDLREKLTLERVLQKTQIQLLQAEKMGSLGKLAAGVAHQLNNPLGGITLFAQLMLEEYELVEDAKQDLKRIIDDAERCRHTVRELLEFARQTRQEIRLNDINYAISQTLFLLENQSLFHNIEIEKDLDTSLPKVPSDIQQLNHVFMNVILNAAEAMEGQGRLTVQTMKSRSGNNLVIRISDTGPGIPMEVLPHIFDPFYTTKEEGKGTGLGLSLAYGILEHHKGRIYAENNTDKGTSFIIILPLNESIPTEE